MTQNASVTPITTIDGKSHALILKEAKEALNAVLSKYGLTVAQAGNSTRNAEGTFANVKYTITVAPRDGVSVGPEAQAYTRYAESEGLDPAWLGKSLPHPTMGDLTITGFRPKARKAPILVKEVRTGKSYIYTISGIKSLARRAGWTLPAHWSNDPKYIDTLISKGL